MKPTGSLFALTSAALLALSSLTAQAAVERGTVDGGVRYAMGGIGLGERAQLQAQRDQYNLWVSTAARSGAYLADVDLRVIDQASGRVVLQGSMNGPWLFAALPPGRYQVEATAAANGQTLTRAVRVRDAALQHAVLHFDVADTTAIADAAGSRTLAGR